MVYVSGMRIGLWITDAALRTMITTDAAPAVLRKVDVVGKEDGKGVGLNLGKLGDEALYLRIEPIDVHQSSLESEYRSCRPVTRRRAQSLFRQHRRPTQQQVIVLSALHRAPEIRALVCVNILRSAHVGSALDVGRAGIKNGRPYCVVGDRLTIRQHIQGIICALRSIPRRDHYLQRN